MHNESCESQTLITVIIVAKDIRAVCKAVELVGKWLFGISEVLNRLHGSYHIRCVGRGTSLKKTLYYVQMAHECSHVKGRQTRLKNIKHNKIRIISYHILRWFSHSSSERVSLVQFLYETKCTAGAVWMQVIHQSDRQRVIWPQSRPPEMLSASAEGPWTACGSFCRRCATGWIRSKKNQSKKLIYIRYITDICNVFSTLLQVQHVLMWWQIFAFNAPSG